MTKIKRYLTPAIVDDLADKMVFIGGPRQVGKTTLALEGVGASLENSYYNWDKIQQRLAAIRGEWPPAAKLVILDEFHKYRKWKTWLKGEWDTRSGNLRFLLTGSARMNMYRRGADSLQGRYHYYTLHPFSMAELHGCLPAIKPFSEIHFEHSGSAHDIDVLLRYGGFPESYLKQDERFTRRWHQECFELLFKEDIRDLTQLQDLTTLMLLAEMIPNRISSILSLNSIAQDLQVNFRTVARWMDVFEQFYYCFRLSPFQSRAIASVKKEKKLYLWDWSQVPDEPKRYENLIASSLLKYCDYLHDREGYKATLHYVRDDTGREVDFLVAIDNKPWFAVEAKLSDSDVSKTMLYFKERLGISFCYQVVKNTERDFINRGIRIIPAKRFLMSLV